MSTPTAILSVLTVLALLPVRLLACQNPLCFPPMSARDIQSLPSAVAKEFRSPANYVQERNNVDAWYAVGSNCASFALNKWGDHSYSGSYLADFAALTVTRSPCSTIVEQVLKNARLTAYRAVNGACPNGGYIVVPFAKKAWNVSGFSFNSDTHLVRQLPDGRFAHVQGPDDRISWIYRRKSDGTYEPATTIAHLTPFLDLDLCPAVCVNPDRTTTPANPTLVGTYSGLVGHLTFASDGTYVLDSSFGQRIKGSFKVEGDRVFLSNLQAGGEQWFHIRGGCLVEPFLGSEQFCQGRKIR